MYDKLQPNIVSQKCYRNGLVNTVSQYACNMFYMHIVLMSCFITMVSGNLNLLNGCHPNHNSVML